jgi:hypothetical protein
MFFHDRPTFRRIAGECGFPVEEVEYKRGEHAALRARDLRSPERSIGMDFECPPPP